MNPESPIPSLHHTDLSSVTALQITPKAPIRLLQIILQGSLEPQSAYDSRTTAHKRQPELQQIPIASLPIALKRLRSSDRLGYQSALAHQLAAQTGCSASDLAEYLLGQLEQWMAAPAAQLRIAKDALAGLEVKATAGYLQFEFKAIAIAYWLNALLQPDFLLPDPTCFQPFALEEQPSFPNLSKQLFALQHAHARCCSLLRLAQDARWIRLVGWAGNWTVSSKVVWLDATQQFVTTHPTEQRLIQQLLITLDELATTVSSPKPILRCALELETAFQAVHRACPLFGELHTQRDRLSAHLALLLCTQRLLHSLLEHYLGVAAPNES